MALIAGFWGVRYQVRDVERSITFYTQTLGFTLDMQNLPAFGQVSIGGLKLIGFYTELSCAWRPCAMSVGARR